MPKTNDDTGATYVGHDGVVEHAGGRASTRQPYGLSQLDPSRNLDGSVVDGFESDEREIKEEDVSEKDLRGDSTEVEPLSDNDDDSSEDEEEEVKKEEKPSVGNSSKTSSATTAKTTQPSMRRR